MIHPASWFSAGVGFCIASIPGALLGALLGYQLDRRLQLGSWSQLLELLGRQSPLGHDQLRFMLLGRLARCNGHVQQIHIEQAQDEMRRLGLNQQAVQLAEAAFRRGKQSEAGLYKALNRLRDQHSEAQSLLLSCWRMVEATGGATPAERQALLRWGAAMGWSGAQVEALTIGLGARQGSMLVSSDGAYPAALHLLGVTSDCDPATIKRAYRRLLSRHHPDKKAGEGANAEQLRSATEKTRELRNAYALIRERKGFR